MAGMWRLGGLSAAELLKRTARESWEDDVFGLAARLAFYHFLAIFPVLLLVLIPLAALSGAGADMRGLLTRSVRQFLPSDAASLVSAAVADLDSNARASGALVIAILGAAWAGFNASWAMISGLNTAYETEEDRSFGQIAARSACLGLAVVVLVVAALFATHYIGRPVAGSAGSLVRRGCDWAAIVLILMISFGLFYRYGPNLKNDRWQWSTPGAVFGAALWVASTLAVQAYFDHFGSEHRVYGRLGPVAALLIWLYMTSATVLIGAELNAEIEKAADGRDQPGPPNADAAVHPRPRAGERD